MAEAVPLTFFFIDTATTDTYTLSLHDALPICRRPWRARCGCSLRPTPRASTDRKSTRLNSSHLGISYAVFCLKKKIHFVLRRPPALRGARGGRRSAPV